MTKLFVVRQSGIYQVQFVFAKFVCENYFYLMAAIIELVYKMNNMLAKSVLRLIARPTVYYPIILLVAFFMLRFINNQFESFYDFRILNPAIMGIIIGYFFG